MPEGTFRILRMKQLRKIISIALSAAFSMAFMLSAASCGRTDVPHADEGNYRIVTSFYPIQILTMNVAGNIDGVSVECMSEPNIGCIHDHTFTTEDLRMLEDADIYIENGLGLETFNDRVLESYPDLTIVEAAADVSDAPLDEDEVNGHVWTSLDDYILMIKSVADSLAAADPVHAEEYASNAGDYISRVEALQDEYADVIDALNGMPVLVIDETLPSFCVYAGMDYITLETDHEQSAVSAGDIGEIISHMNTNGINVIFVGTDGDTGIAGSIAAETNADIYALNTCMTGEVDADAYLAQMEENFSLLRDIG